MTKTALLILTALASSLLPSTAAERPWFQRSLVGLEVGPTGSQFGQWG
jgi:hypothetical protein